MTGNPLLHGFAPTSPGEILREDILPAVNLPKTEIARRLVISRQTLDDPIEERQPVTPATALRLGRLFGDAPEFWANFQRDHDLRILEVRMVSELTAIDPLGIAYGDANLRV